MYVCFSVTNPIQTVHLLKFYRIYLFLLCASESAQLFSMTTDLGASAY